MGNEFTTSVRQGVGHKRIAISATLSEAIEVAEQHRGNNRAVVTVWDCNGNGMNVTDTIRMNAKESAHAG
jgi:hypothetical protein